MKFPAFIACGAIASLIVVSQPLRSLTDEPIFRVGHGVTAPHPLNHPAPEYSGEARRAGLQGECVLSLIVNSEGKPEDISVSRGLGMGLDEQSVEAVQNWTFEPARKDGKPVAVRINVVTTFRLENLATTPEGRAELRSMREANAEFHRMMWKRVYRVEGSAPAPLCRSAQHEGEVLQLDALGLKADPRQYVLGAITFTDNKNLSNAAALRALFPIKDGQAAAEATKLSELSV